jgi:NAD(P)-dependent dehydrogenase (short-subunit alcohol dehydrogenase family)
MQQIWFITGISSGLGKAIAEAALQAGHFVIGTFRQAAQVEAFQEQYEDQAAAYQLDLTNGDQIAAVSQEVIEQFGRIDVLVNNAGYGLAGAVEETSDAEARAVFEANFFGTLALTRAFLPQFRAQRSGHIVQLSSHGGIKAFAGFGLYNASKFALEGMSEALAAEVGPLGIRLTIVEPGPFRTEFAGGGFAQAETRIADYDDTAGTFRARMAQVAGKQEGDPAKAAAAILHITTLEQPPLRLPLGKIALGTIGAKLASVQQDMEAWRHVAEGAVF